jgi:hypothetical protein
MLIQPGSANLPASSRLVVLTVTLSVSVVIGFLAGTAMVRRIVDHASHTALFCCLAGGVAGGLVGCVSVLALTASYLLAYETWPSDLLYQILTIAAFPAFGAAGLCLGALVGLAAGGVVGAVLRVATLGRR